MANSSRVEINSSVTDSLRSVHGIVYMIFYGRIRIPGISGNFGACADSVYQALLSAHEREPGFEANDKYTKTRNGAERTGPDQYTNPRNGPKRNGRGEFDRLNFVLRACILPIIHRP